MLEEAKAEIDANNIHINGFKLPNVEKYVLSREAEGLPVITVTMRITELNGQCAT